MKLRFWLGILAFVVPTFPLGYVWHLVLFKDYYEALAIYRAEIVIPFGVASMLIQGAVSAGQFLSIPVFFAGLAMWLLRRPTDEISYA